MANIIIGLLIAYSVWMTPGSDGSQLIYTGALLNFIAVASNGWQMPVFAPGLTQERLAKSDPFHRHKLGDSNTNFKLLCDWLDFDFMISSPGDLLMFYGAIMNYSHQRLIVTNKAVTLELNWRW